MTNKFLDYVKSTPPHKWYWNYLSANPQITWEDVKAYPEFVWSPFDIAKNANITLDMLPEIADRFNVSIHTLSRAFKCFNPNIALKVITTPQYKNRDVTANAYYAMPHICKSRETTIETVEATLKQLPWQNELYLLLQNQNFHDPLIVQRLTELFPYCSNYLQDVDNPFTNNEELKWQFEMCFNRSRSDLCTKTYRNLTLLTESELDEWSMQFPVLENRNDPCFLRIFGACPCVTLDILEKWISMPCVTYANFKTSMRIISQNPNLTVEFLQCHPELPWDWTALSCNPMWKHPCFDCNDGPLYVLK